MKQRPSFPARLDASAPRAAKPSLGAMPKNTVSTGIGLDSVAVRLSMVRKLQAQGISDPMVLSAMGQVERHRFVDTA
ncbi:MAG: protein-L-isoaspartate O-methyltransferase, partial [Betaproteobacteria bacterium]|nr:protein-L-isoaspartate O-methyltransferase [Betaproteobacteria bacterium]